MIATNKDNLQICRDILYKILDAELDKESDGTMNIVRVEDMRRAISEVNDLAEEHELEIDLD